MFRDVSDVGKANFGPGDLPRDLTGRPFWLESLFGGIPGLSFWMEPSTEVLQAVLLMAGEVPAAFQTDLFSQTHPLALPRSVFPVVSLS